MLLMPGVGAVKLARARSRAKATGAFRTPQETTRPGYYRVLLPDQKSKWS